MKAPKQSTIFDDDPPATPPVRHATDKEPPAAAERLSVAESAADGDVRAAPVWADVLADFFSGGQ